MLLWVVFSCLDQGISLEVDELTCEQN